MGSTPVQWKSGSASTASTVGNGAGSAPPKRSQRILVPPTLSMHGFFSIDRTSHPPNG